MESQNFLERSKDDHTVFRFAHRWKETCRFRELIFNCLLCLLLPYQLSGTKPERLLENSGTRHISVCRIRWCGMEGDGAIKNVLAFVSCWLRVPDIVTKKTPF